MKKFNVLFLTIFLLIIVSCNCDCDKDKEPEKPSEIPIAVTVPVPQAELHFEWHDEYKDHFLISSLKKDGQFLLNNTPADYSDFINTWPATEQGRIKFWGNILVKMAYYESKWNGSAEYKESFGVYSRGLFQVSLVDAKRYGCHFTTEQSVHDNEANINCAVRIMSKLIKQNGRIAGRVNGRWQGGARYWSVLRGTRDYTRAALKSIKQVNK